MAYYLYAIKPEHREKYNNLNIFDNIWYKEIIKYKFCIPPCWVDGFFDNEKKHFIPFDLQYFYHAIQDTTTSCKFIKVVKTYFDKNKLEIGEDLKKFINWLEFWSKKKSIFILDPQI